MLRIDLHPLLAFGLLAFAPSGTTPDLAVQHAYIKASNTGTVDVFGRSVALSGDTLVVGAAGEDSNATGVNGDQDNDLELDSGAAYVLVRGATGWTQQAYLKQSNTQTQDAFGVAVAISGDTLVVGAPFEASAATGVNGDQANNDAPFSGAAYIFVRDGETWSQQAYLKASNASAGDNFGWSVAVLSEDAVAIGAQLEDSDATGVDGDQGNDNALDSGAVYVFTRSGTTWSQAAYLKASNTDAFDHFGGSLSGEQDTLVIGASFEDGSATGVNGDPSDDGSSNAGAAYVFVRNGTSWAQEAYLKASNTAPTDEFGNAVGISNGTIVVGSYKEDSAATGVNGDQGSNGALLSGAAYVFTHDGTGWSQEAYLKASNTGPADLFGSSVALAGDVLVVGAFQEASNASGVNGDQSNNSLNGSGAAYVFTRGDGGWGQLAYLKASNPRSFDVFGGAVAVAGRVLVVGATGERSSATGINGDQSSSNAPSSGAVYAFGVGFLGSVAARNAGTNPASYSASTIEIGLPFLATADNGLAGQLTSRLIAFEAPISILLAGGQTLLCLDLGAGELFTGSSLAPTSSMGGVDSYEVLVPHDSALAGLTLCSQAIQFGNPPFVLSNALDFTIGGF